MSGIYQQAKSADVGIFGLLVEKTLQSKTNPQLLDPNRTTQNSLNIFINIKNQLKALGRIGALKMSKSAQNPTNFSAIHRNSDFD